MILSAYSVMGAYFDIIDKETGEKLKGVQWADDKLNKLMVLKPNSDPKSREEYEIDPVKGYVTVEVYREIEFIRNTSYIGIFVGIIKRTIVITLNHIIRTLTK